MCKQNNFASGGHVNVVERFTQTCIKQFIFVGLATMISSSARHHMVPKTYIGSMLLCDFLVWSTPSTGAGSLKSQGKSSTGHTKGPWQPWHKAYRHGQEVLSAVSTLILLLSSESWPAAPSSKHTLDIGCHTDSIFQTTSNIQIFHPKPTWSAYGSGRSFWKETSVTSVCDWTPPGSTALQWETAMDCGMLFEGIIFTAFLRLESKKSSKIVWCVTYYPYCYHNLHFISHIMFTPKHLDWWYWPEPDWTFWNSWEHP